MFARLQSDLLGTRQIINRSVLRSTMATATFDVAVRLLGLLSVLRWRHTGQRRVDRRDGRWALYLFSYRSKR